LNDPRVAKRAKELGICSVPAVVVNGKLADRCAERARLKRSPVGRDGIATGLKAQGTLPKDLAPRTGLLSNRTWFIGSINQ